MSILALLLLAQTIDKPVRAVNEPGVVTTQQNITPAGVPTVFDGRVYGVAFGKDSREVWVLHAQRLYRLDWRENRVVENIAHGAVPGLAGLAYDAVLQRPFFSSTLRSNNRNSVQFATVDSAAVSPFAKGLGQFLAGSPALAAKANSKGQRLAVLPLLYDNKLAVLRLDQRGVVGQVATGIAPYAAVVASDGTAAWVSNWGGRLPKPGDLTAPTGLEPNADQVVVDARGIAATGSVTRVDLNTMQATHQIPVQLHPTAMALDEARGRLYVANTNSDSVSIVDTALNAVARTVALVPFGRAIKGIAPTALALTRDGRTLYVACGGINAVLVLDTATGAQRGMIPTAWYPSSLALSPDEKHLAVGALLGTGSGWREAPTKRFVHAYRGSVAVVDVPDAAQLASYTTAVLENNRQPLRATGAAPNASAKPKAIPVRAGEPSLIEHVVYIIKENRTYDQLFGDLPRGNGDASLVMFGEDVTPNQRRLAQEFVLLDNFYATGGNSADGHQWATQANETSYCLWPGYTGRSYPFDGTDPIAYSSGGFLWDYALARKKTVRVYGEYAGRMAEPIPLRQQLLEQWMRGEDFSTRWKITAPIAGLNKILATNYPAYTNSIPDVVRAQIFLKDLAAWEKSGAMPNLTILLLPSDHTFGTTPAASTPKAMVADNDLALGRIVEGLSASRFWKKMAIFVVEDDAQNGVDHVDGHRTVALAISPYARRQHVDSTFYAHQSMLKTIELILGLPTMSLFDLIANEMRQSFTDTPDWTPYKAVTPKQNLMETNPPVKALRGAARDGALRSARMRWDVPDAVPTERLNRIVWHSIKGWRTPYPKVKQSVFAPLGLEGEEDEEDEK
jgi:YVTN family beta-propeller protein